MRIMFFCWAQEIQNEFLHVAKYLSRFEQDFILTPLIRFKDKIYYDRPIAQLSGISEKLIVSPIYLKSPNSSFSNLLNPNIFFSDFLSITKAIRQAKPDVIVCFYISHAYPLTLLKKFSKFSLCIVAMGSDVNLENSFLQKKARKFVFMNSNLIFARSWELKDKIEGAHKCQVVVSPSSTDTSFFKPLDHKAKLREKWHIDLKTQVVLTVCRLDKNKGVDVLLRALQQLRNQEIKVLIVGDGTERKTLETMVTTLDLQNKVVFLGHRSKMELLELYNLSDIFTLTSYAEGLPRVLIEAMACGCIPIATDVGSVSALIANGHNGFTLTPGDYIGLSDKIEKILAMSGEERKQIQTMARYTIVENFDSKKIWEDMVETIKTSVALQHKDYNN